MKTLSQNAVRGLMIAALGLQQRLQKPATKADVLQIIRQMHLLQIDTISVVARSPYLVLWSRLGDYSPHWLDELLSEGKLFEYWAHAACFLPIEDYPLYRRFMLNRLVWQETQWRKWIESHPGVLDKVLAHVREHGAVRSADFENTTGAKGGWWNWKDEKTALEGLWLQGDLMVSKRHNFQRVYDLRERIHPTWDDSRSPSLETVHETLLLNTVRALGVAKVGWIARYFDVYRTNKKIAQPVLEKLVKSGQVQTIQVEGWDEPGYFHADQKDAIEAAADGQIPFSKTTLLSPFDPLVSDRARGEELFNFSYRIECYTPAARRLYGYFTLPILYNNTLIGRIDPKAHRKERLFEVKALHLEPNVIVDDALVAELKSTLQACAAWHNTPQVVVRKATIPGLAERLST